MFHHRSILFGRLGIVSQSGNGIHCTVAIQSTFSRRNHRKLDMVEDIEALNGLP